MWKFFNRSLQLFPTSLLASIVASATNFMVTALLGKLIFGDSLSYEWWVGTVLIMIGMIFIQSDSAAGSKAKDQQPTQTRYNLRKRKQN